MKTITKIVWKDELSYFWCCGSAPMEKTTLTLTRDEVQFKRIARMNDYMGDEYPFSEANESWKLKIKHADYSEAFAAVAAKAEEVVNGLDMNLVFDGPVQSLIVYYDDGSKAKLNNMNSYLLEEKFLRDQLSRFLPERMSQTIFSEIEGEDE